MTITDVRAHDKSSGSTAVRSRWPKSSIAEITSFGGLPRSQLMSRIRSKNNRTTERQLASLLHKHHITGWRRHGRIIGKPDFVWARKRVALFVDGCFWHGHTCDRNLTPKKNARAWRRKILRNQRRDQKISRELRRRGWKVIRIWECLLKQKHCVSRIVKALHDSS